MGMIGIDIDPDDGSSRSIDDDGYAVDPPGADRSAVPGRLLARGFDDDSRYRSTIDMRRHGFGSGLYRYFDHPLPELVQALRVKLYDVLAPIALRDWAARLGTTTTYPPTLRSSNAATPTSSADPHRSCSATRPGDFNALHQDVYGDLGFPLQAVIVLDRPGEDFTGGELLLVTQIPPVANPSARPSCHAVAASSCSPMPDDRCGKRVGLVRRQRPPRGQPWLPYYTPSGSSSTTPPTSRRVE